MENTHFPRVLFRLNGSDRSGKAIQVKVGELDYLFVGDSDRFHGQHLEMLLSMFRIRDFERDKKNNFPLAIGKDYQLIGAGQCSLYLPEYIFGGTSFAYDLGINREALEKAVGFFPLNTQIMYVDPKTFKHIELGVGRGEK